MLPLAAILCAVVAIYWWSIHQPGFGPEFSLFYVMNAGKTWRDVLAEYSGVGRIWYRPTGFMLPYWIGQMFISWHDLLSWKWLHLASLVPCCWSVYLLTLCLFPAQRIAGMIAALYVAIYPGMFSVVLATSAFDVIHVTMAVASVCCFGVALYRSGRIQVGLIAASVLFYVLALTAKESAMTVPVYLFVVVALRSGGFPDRRRLKEYGLLLLPFAIVLGLYLWLHVARMPSHGGQGLYRTQYNDSLVRENLIKYPLWIVRVFRSTGDTAAQTFGHTHLANTLTGLSLFALTSWYWLRAAVRDRTERMKLVLLLSWIAIFMAIPVYAGGFMWHVSLALCGYAILCGAGVSRLVDSVRRPGVRVALLGVVFSWIGWAGYSTSQDIVLRSVHSLGFRVGSKVLNEPPVPSSRIGRNALVFVEDRRNLGSWNFGGDYLFQYVYLDTTLRQKEVPAMASVSPELCAEWLRHPNPFFLQHDDDFNWRDGSWPFRQHALEVLPQYTSVLLGNQKWSDAVSLLGPLLPEAERTPAGYLLLYHHAYSLHQMGKLQQAVDAYGRSIALNHSYSLPVLQRGYALAAIGKPVDACADFRKSAQLEPRQPVHEDTLKKYCR